MPKTSLMRRMNRDWPEEMRQLLPTAPPAPAPLVIEGEFEPITAGSMDLQTRALRQIRTDDDMAVLASLDDRCDDFEEIVDPADRPHLAPSI